MGRLPDTDEGVRAVGRGVINRFDADRSLRAQIPELEDWSWASSPGDRARNADDSCVFIADQLESVCRSMHCAAALERKKTPSFLSPLFPPKHVICVNIWLNVRIKCYLSCKAAKMWATTCRHYCLQFFLWSPCVQSSQKLMICQHRLFLFPYRVILGNFCS